MDKFVVKTSRNLHPKVKNTSDKKHLSQSTLQSLAGVVVIEDFIKAKNSLEDKSETCEKKIEILKQLLNKNPSKEVLIQVGIGKTVRKLRKEVEAGSDDKLITVAKLSEKVYRKWRNELERKVELKHNPVRVKCDQETERLRSAAVKFILAALQDSEKQSVNEEKQSLSERLELELFNQSNKLVNSFYRRLSRKVIFALKSEICRTELLKRKVSVKDFVVKFIKNV